MKGKAWLFGRRLVACWVGSALLWAGYIGLALEPYNRFNMFFDGWDTAALILLVTGCGLVAALLLHLAAKCSEGRSDRLLSPWFFFWLVLVGFNFRPALRLSLVEAFPWLSGTIYYLLIWALGLLLTAGGYRWGRMRRLASTGWRVLVYLWPLLPILFFNLLAAHRWENTSDVPSEMGRHIEGAGPPVVVIILDMIGHSDLFEEDGTVKATLPRLASFAETATLYHQARSPGDETGRSLPGLFLQEEVSALELGSGPPCWVSADHPERESRPASAFEESLSPAWKQAGYRQVVIGYYLPYKELMPEAFDEVFTRSYYGAAQTGAGRSELGNALVHQGMRFVEESKDPVSALLKQCQWPVQVFTDYYRELVGAVQEEGVRFIQQSLSAGDFALIHLPVPHQPYVFDAEGRPSTYAYLDPAGYPDQLEYADRLFGELTEAIRQTGLWEDSWVIFLSDHGPHFRDYTGTVDGKRHVPLMVKAPGQRDRQDVDAPIRLADLKRIPGFPLSQMSFPSDEEGDAVEE